jgi:sec-independent protein translocase protein TatB
VFGVSFTEFFVLGTVALLVLGPEKLPGMLRTMGHWIAKLRKLTTEVRHQSGIDEVLRAEGFDGGLNEVRSMMRGGAASHSPPVRQPLPDPFVADKSREYPVEGPDAYGALPEDLVTPLAPAPLESPETGPTAIAALPVTSHAAAPALPSADSAAPTPALPGAEAPALPSAEANTSTAPDPAALAIESPEATR